MVSVCCLELTVSWIDSETEKRELQQQVKVLKEALNERQVATVTTIEGDLAQLLKSVEKNQVYIGYPNFGMVLKFINKMSVESLKLSLTIMNRLI